MKLKLSILILIFVFIGAFLYLNGGRVENDGNNQTTSTNERLVISPQETRASVMIDEATLTQDGFVVARGSDGKRLGQIIEISKYLQAGDNRDITIGLGDFYTYNESEQLIAMIYHDNGDKIFNELDQPTNIAVFVKTGQSVPLAVLEEQIVPSNGMGMETVRYTNNGFQPAKLTVPLGTMVEFVNQSDKTMWVASNVHPEHAILPTFDQFKEVPKGQSYMYVFDKEGSWSYHDHLSPSFEGVINVE